MLPYECEDNGIIHFHWGNFNNYLNLYKKSYPHNTNCRRIRITAVSPRVNMLDLPLPMKIIPSEIKNPHDWKYYSDDWSVIFEPFHFHVHDPEPSWLLFLEKGHKKPTYGDPIELFSTGLTLFDPSHNRMARFRGHYYVIDTFIDFGYGDYYVQVEKQKKFRSIDDNWGEEL